jgi:CopA family copper-resistance protein
MNGRTPSEGWTGLFKKGEKVRLRFINGSAMSFFDVRIPGLEMTVVAADGQPVEPVSVEEFRIGVAETYDVIVQPKDDRAYTLFAQDIARSGYARGTLTPDMSLLAEVPAMDPVPDLGHSDMGMGMMHHMGHDMAGMDHAAQGKAGMDHSMHGMDKCGAAMMSVTPSNSSDFTAVPVHHAATEYGPHVDMRSDNPQYRLDDPGVGLRNNGRRVLTYADLRNLHSTREAPDPSRELELHLTGNMERYMWSINGIKFAAAEPLRWRLGERLRITFVNDTMMNHPMHLHGMWSDLETGDNNRLPRKHTVIVQPGSRISYRVSVDAPGGWAYHCHLLYHMLGMFRTVQVS